MNNKVATGLAIQFGNAFTIYLKVDIKNLGDSYEINAKKINFKIISTNNVLTTAKKEFVESLAELITMYMEEKILFKIFELWGLKKQSHSDAKKTAFAENKKTSFETVKNSYSADLDFMINNKELLENMNSRMSWVN